VAGATLATGRGAAEAARGPWRARRPQQGFSGRTGTGRWV